MTVEPMRWLDANRQPLFAVCQEQVGSHLVGVAEEELFSLTPAGQVETIPGIGSRIYTGTDALVPGSYSVTVGAWGTTRAHVRELKGQVTRAAILTRWVQKGNAELPIARWSSIKPVHYAAVSEGARVTAVFEPALAYWLLPEVTGALVAGNNAVNVLGEGPVTPRLTLTAAQAVVNPSVTTDAGVSTWHGTLQAGQTLVIDATPGVWSVTRGGVDVRTALTGPQPSLKPGMRTVTLSAGLSGTLSFRPAVLEPDGVLPDVEADGVYWEGVGW
ncbi:hypothetical protein [Deinococcus hopiensis]|uniref:Uncharacterized protein n=1 Tax=Deinococcus hopiensis KR-140 TaxID=695939 RepID=A0A1W1UYD0_9DEIO|nr:hypothetical protein [Deinococcus hopiensis]SMB85764.1 hypothetical protein SAMN00790413_03531 [Deinococcus hopiensis KR-140]